MRGAMRCLNGDHVADCYSLELAVACLHHDLAGGGKSPTNQLKRVELDVLEVLIADDGDADISRCFGEMPAGWITHLYLHRLVIGKRGQGTGQWRVNTEHRETEGGRRTGIAAIRKHRTQSITGNVESRQPQNTHHDPNHYQKRASAPIGDIGKRFARRCTNVHLSSLVETRSKGTIASAF